MQCLFYYSYLDDTESRENPEVRHFIPAVPKGEGVVPEDLPGFWLAVGEGVGSGTGSEAGMTIFLTP